MCITGANVYYYSENYQSWFYDPAKPLEKIFVFFDAADTLGLVRNTLRDDNKLIYYNGHKICWEHIVNLQNIQESKGLYAANKLNIAKILYDVRLAAQNLSKSVSDGFPKLTGLAFFIC